MSIDIVCCNPKDVLYPWWMARMNKDRKLFNKLIVVMTQQATEINFTNYISSNLEDADILESYPDNGTDWRNSAINEALKHNKSERVLFLEQDFLVDDDFFSNLLSRNDPVIGFRAGNRLHPACLLVKRNILERTDKDFSVDKDVGDHFYKFTKQLEKLTSPGKLTGTFYHLNGLTQNYRLDENWYQPQIFNQYNKLSMQLPQHHIWREFCRVKDQQMGEFSKHPIINLEKYFKNL